MIKPQNNISFYRYTITISRFSDVPLSLWQKTSQRRRERAGLSYANLCVRYQILLSQKCLKGYLMKIFVALNKDIEIIVLVVKLLKSVMIYFNLWKLYSPGFIDPSKEIEISRKNILLILEGVIYWLHLLTIAIYCFVVGISSWYVFVCVSVCVCVCVFECLFDLCIVVI